jgi:spermidine/putrescine transport system permease protein/putrescine transport system permease protein
VAGAAFAFLLSFDDVVISSYLTGVGSTTLPVFVYAQASKRGISPEIVALSTLMVTVTALLLVIGVVIASWRARRVVNFRRTNSILQRAARTWDVS